MVEIRPALMPDRGAVLRYLRGAGGGARPYEKLFDYSWRHPDWNLGYLLADGDRVRGFIGHVYSDRSIGGRRRRLANQTTWSVDPDWRRHSLDLFQAALREPDVTFTNFSANDQVQKILEAFKFRRLDSGKVVVSPHHGLLGRASSRIATADAADPSLDPESRRIVEAHAALGCRAFIVENDRARGLVVTLRRLFKGIPYADVLHASVPPSLFLSLGAHLVLRERVVGLGVQKRFLGDAPFLRIDNRRPSYFLSPDLDPRDIDALFSEFPLLYGAPL